MIIYLRSLHLLFDSCSPVLLVDGRLLLLSLLLLLLLLLNDRGQIGRGEVAAATYRIEEGCRL